MPSPAYADASWNYIVESSDNLTQEERAPRTRPDGQTRGPEKGADCHGGNKERKGYWRKRVERREDFINIPRVGIRFGQFHSGITVEVKVQVRLLSYKLPARRYLLQGGGRMRARLEPQGSTPYWIHHPPVYSILPRG